MHGLRNTREWRQSKYSHHSRESDAGSFCGSEIEYIWQKSWRMGFYRGGPVFMSALAGIDIALWDLKGETRH